MPAFEWYSQQDPVCKLVLHVETPGKARLSAFAPGNKGPSECHGLEIHTPEYCHEKCLDRKSTPADLKGCDCSPYEVNACTPYGTDLTFALPLRMTNTNVLNRCHLARASLPLPHIATVMLSPSVGAWHRRSASRHAKIALAPRVAGTRSRAGGEAIFQRVMHLEF